MFDFDFFLVLILDFERFFLFDYYEDLGRERYRNFYFLKIRCDIFS